MACRSRRESETPGRRGLGLPVGVSEAFQPSRTLLVGGDGIDVDTFLTTPVRHWL